MLETFAEAKWTVKLLRVEASGNLFCDRTPSSTSASRRRWSCRRARRKRAWRGWQDWQGERNVYTVKRIVPELKASSSD